MPRPRAPSAASEEAASEVSSTLHQQEQELGSMYDYLAKIILLGPSGAGKSCLLHRFINRSFRVLSSQTIGVEFSSKIVKIGTHPNRKRIKLQLWDTAGTERFRSVSRSYYRGAAGAILVYDVASLKSFAELPTFLMDARALASPGLVKNGVPVCVEVSALTGDSVDELFNRLASIILTKIELGEIDPDDPRSGIQYGDVGGWDGASTWSGIGADEGTLRRRKKGGAGGGRGRIVLSEWADVFRPPPGSRQTDSTQHGDRLNTTQSQTQHHIEADSAPHTRDDEPNTT
ncbi:hypothetical protein DV737_g4958, partial [Chaetothyriales sp. CBS 132003]